MIEVKNLVKEYSTKGGAVVRALDDVSVQFPETGMVFLLGKSGSGKSTLLNVLGGLDKPDSGEVIVKGRSSKDFSNADFDSYRNTFIGFIFQEYNVLNEFTVEQNIALALQLQNKSAGKSDVENLLSQVDMSGLGKRKPNTLSGGQKQRVAIARALIKEPEIIMADEPTGALDSNTGKQVLETLKKLSKTKLVIVVSHDVEFAELYGDRIIELKDGKIVADVTKAQSKPQKLNANVQLVSNDTISVADAEKLTEEDVKSIVNMLKANGGEAIITTGKREMPEIKRACKINENGLKEYFEKTNEVCVKDYDGKNTKFIKSKLPAMRAVKMGASSLKTKPIRLVFTVLLSVIAFVMFGVVSTFMLYDQSYSISEALKVQNNPSIALSKSYFYYDKGYEYNLVTGQKSLQYSNKNKFNTRFGVQELNEKNLLTSCSYAGIFDFTNRTYNQYSQMKISLVSGQNSIYANVSASLKDYYLEDTVWGFTDCGPEYMQNNGFTLISGQYPQDKTQVAIPEYFADLFVNTQNSGITSVSQMVGQKIKISGNSAIASNVEFTVSGVYNVGGIPQKYDELKNSSSDLNVVEKEELKAHLRDCLMLSFNSILYVTSDFYNEYKAGIPENHTFSLDGRTAWGLSFGESMPQRPTSKNQGPSAFKKSQAEVYGVYFKFYDKQGNEMEFALEDGQVFVSKDINVNSPCYYINYHGQKGELEVVGYFEIVGNARTSSNYIITDNFYNNYCVADWIEQSNKEWYNVSESEYQPPVDEKYNFIITLTDNSQAQISQALSASENVSYEIENSTYDQIIHFVNSINNMKPIFLIIGAVFAVFSALMLLNFISVSISAKRKDIGILRAVGARGVDVFKIFFAEAFIIALICFVLASVGAFFTCGLLNNTLTTLTSIKLLNFQVIDAMFILAISLFVCILATFLPVYFEARKSPVESIRNN